MTFMLWAVIQSHVCFSCFASRLHYRILLLPKKRAPGALKILPKHRQGAPVVSLTGKKAHRNYRSRSPSKSAKSALFSAPSHQEAECFPRSASPKKAAMVTQFFCATRTRMISWSTMNHGRLDEQKINLPPCNSRSATTDKTPDLLPCIAAMGIHAASVCHPRGASCAGVKI